MARSAEIKVKASGARETANDLRETAKAMKAVNDESSQSAKTQGGGINWESKGDALFDPVNKQRRHLRAMQKLAARRKERWGALQGFATGYLANTAINTTFALSNDALGNSMKQDTAQTVVGGITTGAMAGAAFGPKGIAVGAVIGAITGLVTALKQNSDQLKQVRYNKITGDNLTRYSAGRTLSDNFFNFAIQNKTPFTQATLLEKRSHDFSKQRVKYEKAMETIEKGGIKENGRISDEKLKALYDADVRNDKGEKLVKRGFFRSKTGLPGGPIEFIEDDKKGKAFMLNGSVPDIKGSQYQTLKTWRDNAQASEFDSLTQSAMLRLQNRAEPLQASEVTDSFEKRGLTVGSSVNVSGVNERIASSTEVLKDTVMEIQKRLIEGTADLVHAVSSLKQALGVVN